MMRSILPSLLIIFGLGATAARSQTWTFAHQAGSIRNDYGDRVIVDRDDNSYVAGEFQQSASFDSIVAQGQGLWNVYVAKYDPAGNVLWVSIVAHTTDSTSDIFANALALDGAGNIYLGGRFLVDITFTGDTLRKSRGGSDMFLVKLDNAGHRLWAKTPGGVGNGNFGQDGIASLDLDSQGNIYLAGHYNTDAEFDTITVTSTLTNEVFIAKYDSSGKALWVRSGGGPGALRLALGIAVEPGGNSYVTGRFFNTLTLGAFSFDAGDAEQKAFIAKLDPQGTVLWAKEIGSGGYYGTGQDIAVDGDGNAYVVGNFRASISFSDTTLEQNSNQRYAALIVKYDRDGNYKWAMQSGGADHAASPQGVCADPDGNIFFAGSFSGTMDLNGNRLVSPAGRNTAFVVQLSPQRELLLAMPIVGTGSAAAGGVAAAKGGACVVTGAFTDVVNAGTHKLHSLGANDIFIARLDQGNSSVNDPRTAGTPALLLYPNPTTGIVRLNDAAPGERVRVLSTSGALLMETRYTGRLDVSGLPAGAYFVQVGGRSGRLIRVGR